MITRLYSFHCLETGALCLFIFALWISSCSLKHDGHFGATYCDYYYSSISASETAGGIILIAAAVVALIMANTPVQGLYQAFLNLPVAVSIASLEIAKPLLLWINDGLMAIFFLVVGLEVKRELLQGSLAGREKAIFPAIAALGGMLAPALIYLLFNGADEVTRQGWAIPAATDIAFALGVMALLGNRVPTSLKVFLLALAIIDDLGVIIIIALFYTHQVSMVALGVAAAAIVVLALMNWRGVGKHLAVYDGRIGAVGSDPQVRRSRYAGGGDCRLHNPAECQE